MCGLSKIANDHMTKTDEKAGLVQPCLKYLFSNDLIIPYSPIAITHKIKIDSITQSSLKT